MNRLLDRLLNRLLDRLLNRLLDEVIYICISLVRLNYQNQCFKTRTEPTVGPGWTMNRKSNQLKNPTKIEPVKKSYRTVKNPETGDPMNRPNPGSYISQNFVNETINFSSFLSKNKIYQRLIKYCLSPFSFVVFTTHKLQKSQRLIFTSRYCFCLLLTFKK